MKAIGFKNSLLIGHPDSLLGFNIPEPIPTGRQVRVKVEAISVNPVDCKIRQTAAREKALSEPRILGWDAAGTVDEIGCEVSFFKPGDRVYYAGDLSQPGSNQEYQLVDERLVGFAPKKLAVDEAAAIPLTTLTAWELLFRRMGISKGKDAGKTILIIGAAGGVGSIAIQLAKLSGLKVLATASRAESARWCSRMGADVVFSHRDLVDKACDAGYPQVDFIIDLYDLNEYWEAMVALIKPQGKIGSISDPADPVNLAQLKYKSVSFHWEFMFTRSLFQTEDMESQHRILNQISILIDGDSLQSTRNFTLTGFTVENLKQAHRLLEGGQSIGKVVIKF